METLYDWITVAVFGGLVVLFLHRSTQPDPQDTIWHYLPPAIGCAIANWLGNKGMGPASAGVMVAVLAYIVLILKPFGLKFPGGR
jgi:hypothetical protein